MAIAIIAIAFMAIILSRCATNNFVIPKPFAFFRIEPYDTIYKPFIGLPINVELNTSSQASFVNDTTRAKGNEWINVYYPRYKATIYCSYVPVTRSTIEKHISNRIERIMLNANNTVPRNVVFEDSVNHKSASLFFTPAESITPLQFIATDSINYLFSGAVYFDNKITEDSISPVIDYLTDDIVHLLQNLKIND